MPADDSEASLRLFAREVLPVMQSWKTEPMAATVALGLPLRLT
jgi:hypothetical protein